MYEIDFIIGKDFFITAHYTENEILTKFIEYFKDHIDPEEIEQIKHGGHIFYFLLRHIYRSLESHLEKISEDLDIAEEHLFVDRHEDLIEYLSLLNHNVLDFKRALKRHGPILTSLEKESGQFFDKEFSYYMHSLSGEYEKIWNITEDNKEVVKDLQDTNNALLNTKSGETIKKLTMIAIFTLPLTLVASIFGMNAKFMPFIGSSFDFYKIMLVMLFGVVIMVWWTKHKKWL
jgi:magnesium transporter